MKHTDNRGKQLSVCLGILAGAMPSDVPTTEKERKGCFSCANKIGETGDACPFYAKPKIIVHTA